MPYGNDAFEVSAMMLRAATVRRYGAVPEDDLLAPDVQVRWFSGRLTLSLERARELCRT